MTMNEIFNRIGLISLGTKSHILGPRQGNDSISFQTAFFSSSLKRSVVTKVIWPCFSNKKLFRVYTDGEQ